MRIFLAVVIDPALQTVVGELRSRFRVTADRLRWVPPGNLHLTLKFLGEIPEDRTVEVASAAREVAGRTRPFAMGLYGMGAFPSARRPQVVWVGVREGAGRLTDVARDLDTALFERGFPREPKPFRPHLTVARVKATGALNLSTPLAGMADVEVGRQCVGALYIMESRLHRAGPVYRALEEMWLCEAS